MEKTLLGKWSITKAADYCCTLKKNDPEAVYKRIHVYEMLKTF